MSASIVLVGLAANYVVPGVYPQIDFAAGPAGAGTSPRVALIMGNKTASGTATNDTVVYGPDTQTPCQTESDVTSLFGSGSQIHRAWLRFVAVNKSTAIYFIAVTSSAGAAATLVETIATTATSNGNHRTWCVDQFIDTPITNGDTPTTIAANIVSSVNSQTRWPVTANNAAGVITYTAKQPGLEANWIKMQALITPATATIGTTTTLTANTAMSGGTTADSNVAALASILSQRFYYILCCDSDATNIGRVVTQANTQALATTNIRQRVFAGCSDTLANGITLAVAINAPRDEIALATGCDWTPAELAANNMALFSLFENSGSRNGPSRNNFSNFPSQPGDAQFWVVPGTRSGASAGLTPTQINSALNNGLTPLALLPNGKTQLVKRITTRSLNGSTADYRVRDAHKVSIPDWWTDDAVTLTQLQFGGKELMNDPAQGQPFPTGSAVTPMIWNNALKGLVDAYANDGQFGANGPAIKAAIIVQRETSPTTRISALVPLMPVDLADQFALLVQQVS